MDPAVVSEHSMNEPILAFAGDPVGLTVSIAPWPRPDPADSTATNGIQSRVDSAKGTLTLSFTAPELLAAPVEALRRLMQATLPLLQTVAHARATFLHSQVVLDAEQLAATLAGWTATTIPVHSLVGFDFALPGTPPGTGTIGLRALVGQEIVAWPPDDSHRLVCARMVARLAHDMLQHGPILTERRFAAPDAPRGEVTLIPRDVPRPAILIRF